MVNPGAPAVAARHPSPPLVTSSFLSCEGPIPTDFPFGKAGGAAFTTAYTVTLPAACPTSAWTATYTVTEACSGDPSTWHVPDVLPNFDVFTVICDVCETPTQVITCPNALRTEPAVINGNGVTMTAAPTRAAGAPYGPGYGPGEGGRGSHGSFGPGGTGIQSGEGVDPNVVDPGAGGSGTGTGAGAGYGGAAGGAGRPAPGGSPVQPGRAPVVTAGAAPSVNLKKSLAVVTGLVFVVGNLFVL